MSLPNVTNCDPAREKIRSSSHALTDLDLHPIRGEVESTNARVPFAICDYVLPVDLDGWVGSGYWPNNISSTMTELRGMPGGLLAHWTDQPLERRVV